MRITTHFTALVFLVAATTAAAESYKIDPLHTFPYFEINHLGFSTMRGRFNSTKGTLDIDLKKKTGSVTIVIDASSIDTGVKKRDDHLRSPDFLSVEEFPEITFKSTKMTFNGENKATVEGELTITGKTKPVTLDVSQISCGIHPFNQKSVCGFDATAKIERSDFGVIYGLPAVGDNMKLLFQVEGIKE